jgi:hypothetical protein
MARDLMFQQEIKETVQRAYAAITGGGGETVARRHYSDQELAEVPPGAVQWALGVGNPVRYARLQPGQTVLDVGSGGGIDTILAARGVGPEGRAIGLDQPARIPDSDDPSAAGRARSSASGSIAPALSRPGRRGGLGAGGGVPDAASPDQAGVDGGLLLGLAGVG